MKEFIKSKWDKKIVKISAYEGKNRRENSINEHEFKDNDLVLIRSSFWKIYIFSLKVFFYII